MGCHIPIYPLDVVSYDYGRILRETKSLQRVFTRVVLDMLLLKWKPYVKRCVLDLTEHG